MAPSVGISEPAFFALSCNVRKSHGSRRRLPCRMEMQSKTSPGTVEAKGSIQHSQILIPEETLRGSSDLEFTKLQPLDEEFNQECRIFGDFVARKPVLDEEYWTAAWLRAESHWEDRPNERYADSYKRKFAEQEFNDLIRRCKGYHGQISTCFVTVKKEDKNVKRTVLKSVVGTLDLSIRYLLQGESFPGERIKAPLFCSLGKKEDSRYGYVANLCVAKSSRRKGIAINMLKFTIESAKSKGAQQIFVHVHRKNIPAQLLYQKLGFEIVDMASPQLVQEQIYLLCLQTD